MGPPEVKPEAERLVESRVAMWIAEFDDAAPAFIQVERVADCSSAPLLRSADVIARAGPIHRGADDAGHWTWAPHPAATHRPDVYRRRAAVSIDSPPDDPRVTLPPGLPSF